MERWNSGTQNSILQQEWRCPEVPSELSIMSPNSFKAGPVMWYQSLNRGCAAGFPLRPAFPRT